VTFEQEGQHDTLLEGADLMKAKEPLSELDRKIQRRLKRLSSYEIRGYLAYADSGRITLAESTKAKLRTQLAQLDAELWPKRIG
jgi:hypothetical protein